MLRPLSLLFLRLSTGIYLLLWGIIKFNPEKSAALSDKYYGGAISGASISMLIGLAQVILAVTVILGVFRKPAYWAQFIWYGIGAISILPYILDPFGVYLVEAPGKLTFFPSTTLAIASLCLIAFRNDDKYSIDAIRKR